MSLPATSRCPGPAGWSVGARRAGLWGKQPGKSPWTRVWRALGAHRSRNWGPGAVRWCPRGWSRKTTGGPHRGAVKWAEQAPGRAGDSGPESGRGGTRGQDTSGEPARPSQARSMPGDHGPDGWTEPACWGSAGTCRLGAPLLQRKGLWVGTCSGAPGQAALINVLPSHRPQAQVQSQVRGAMARLLGELLGGAPARLGQPPRSPDSCALPNTQSLTTASGA